MPDTSFKGLKTLAALKAFRLPASIPTFSCGKLKRLKNVQEQIQNIFTHLECQKQAWVVAKLLLPWVLSKIQHWGCLTAADLISCNGKIWLILSIFVMMCLCGLPMVMMLMMMLMSLEYDSLAWYLLEHGVSLAVWVSCCPVKLQAKLFIQKPTGSSLMNLSLNPLKMSSVQNFWKTVRREIPYLKYQDGGPE